MAIKDIVPSIKKSLPIKRREEESPFLSLHRQIDQLFENFMRSFEMEPFVGHIEPFSPRVDVAETEKELRISAELPGMDEKDIEISLTRDALTIKGEKKTEKEEKGEDYYRMERSFGSFMRTVPLPAEIETEKAEAHFRKGVLSITLPKSEKAVKETRKIPVKAD